MKVTQVFFTPFDHETTIGFADITLDESLVMKGVKLLKGKYGAWLGFPSQKGKDGKFYDIVFPITKELREDMTQAVLAESGYDKQPVSNNNEDGW